LLYFTYFDYNVCNFFRQPSIYAIIEKFDGRNIEFLQKREYVANESKIRGCQEISITFAGSYSGFCQGTIDERIQGDT